jgi:hypothetical protein
MLTVGHMSLRDVVTLMVVNTIHTSYPNPSEKDFESK